MKNRTRVTIAAAAAAAAAIVLAGCSSGGGPSSSGSSSPKSGGNLVIDRAADASSLNNTTVFDNNSIFVLEQIMEPLFTVSNDGKTVKPWLATGYTVSDDKLTYTIKLRRGVEFSNGQPMTAKDVKFSIDADTKTGSDGWGYINSAIKEVKVVDDATVEIDLKYAWAPIIADLSLFSNAIVPDNYGGESADEFYTHPVGTGPFKWDSWQKGQSLKLTKNTHYWQKGKPYLDSVQWNVVPDANTRKLQIQGGQADVDEYPDWSSFASLKSSPGVVATAFPSTEIDYIAFNQKRAPFNDVHVRQAISDAIDRTALVKAVLYGNGKPADSLLSPGVPYYDGTDGQKYDLAAAKKALAASSVPNGFSTSLLIASGNANQAAVAQILQSELKPLGIDVKITQLDPTANHQAREDSNFDMAYSAWTMDIPDPDEWTSFAVDPAGGSNSAFTFYNDTQVVSLNERAQKEIDDTKRGQLYSQLQKLTAQDAFLAYLYYPPYAYATTDKMSGFFVTPLGNYHLEDVSKK
ncbi:MAG TPA: ABC transporter substrate-binding protein [Gryllotalpicola sp.]